MHLLMTASCSTRTSCLPSSRPCPTYASCAAVHLHLWCPFFADPLEHFNRRVGNSALKLAPSLRRANVLNKVHTLLVDYKLDAKPTRLRNFCDKLPALSEVTIVMYASRKQPQPPARVEACTKSLQRLTLEQDRGARPAPFDLFLQLFDKRQELFVHAVHVCTYVQLPPRYPDLHRFSLPQAHLITSFELFVHAAVPPFMPKLRNLQKFSLVMVSKSGIVDHSVFDRMVLEGLLPTSIQHLKLRCDGYTSDYLPDLLAAHDRAPGLKSVSLDFRLGSKEARDELGAQLHKRGVSLDISTNVF